jgi:hypothetical protein
MELSWFGRHVRLVATRQHSHLLEGFEGVSAFVLGGAESCPLAEWGRGLSKLSVMAPAEHEPVGRSNPGGHL